MNIRLPLLFSLLFLFGVGCSRPSTQQTPLNIQTPTTYVSPTSTTPIVFSLSSPAITPRGPIPYRYTCDAENVNPPLSIIGVPAEAKSLALIVTDPDAHNFVHWSLWNINPSSHFIEESATPTGAIQGPNGFGKREYSGPCPPPGRGSHRYVFTLYALDATMKEMPGTDQKTIETTINAHTIKKTELVGMYERK